MATPERGSESSLLGRRSSATPAGSAEENGRLPPVQSACGTWLLATQGPASGAPSDAERAEMIKVLTGRLEHHQLEHHQGALRRGLRQSGNH